MAVNQHTKLKGNKISIEENIRNLSKGFSELNNKGYKQNQGTKTIKGKRLTRKRKDKDGLGIKYSKLSVNIFASFTKIPR